MNLFARTSIPVVVTICLIACSTSASAQDAARETELATVERAHELYQRGLAAYEIGDYEVAVNAFLASWSMYEDPRLLYNLSLAYWKLGKLDQAMTTAARVIGADVDPGVRIRAHARYAAFGTMMRARQAASEARSVAQREVAEAPPRRAAMWGWLPWVTGAVTLGAAVGAAVVDRQIATTASQMEQAEAANDRPGAVALHDEIERRQLVGRVLLATAAVGATATIVLFVVRPRSDEPRATRVEIGFLPTRVTLTARF